MVAQFDDILRTYLYESLGQPDGSVVDFSFALPNKKWMGKIKNSQNWVNIYLLELRENLELRKNAWRRSYEAGGKVSETKPPVYVDLYYLVTVFNKDGDSVVEHGYLQQLLVSLHNFPDRAPLYIGDAEFLEKTAIELFPKPYIDDHLGFQLWSALDQDVRPYIPIKVTLPLEVSVGRESALVTEKELITEQLGAPLYMLRGEVSALSAGGRIPVAGATVNLRKEDDALIATTTTDGLGKFRFTGVPPTAAKAETTAAGYQTKTVSLEHRPRTAAELLGIVLESD